MNSRIAALFGLVVLSGCAIPTVDPTTSPFDPNEAAFINNRGSGVIEGQGFLRQMGGAVVTCAGADVELIPVTKYSMERITYIYGSPNGGQNVTANISPASADYDSFKRTTQCDAQGNFRFTGLASGEYYVDTQVVWASGGYGLTEGGALAKRVAVKSGQTVQVLLN